MLHLWNGKEALANGPIKITLRECPLHSVKGPRRRNQCPQKNQRFEKTVRKLCLRMDYLVDLPFCLYRLPRQPSVDRESKLVCAGLRILGDSATYFRVDAEVRKSFRETSCKNRKRFLLAPYFLRIMVCELKTVRLMKPVVSQGFRQNLGAR